MAHKCAWPVVCHPGRSAQSTQSLIGTSRNSQSSLRFLCLATGYGWPDAMIIEGITNHHETYIANHEKRHGAGLNMLTVMQGGTQFLNWFSYVQLVRSGPTYHVIGSGEALDPVTGRSPNCNRSPWLAVETRCAWSRAPWHARSTRP